MNLSILIPARNEMFLAKTVENLLENIEGDTEIIVVLDGAWTNPPIEQNERVTIIYNPVSVGQRAATNQAAKLSKARYLMKIDAHCAVDKGFDVKMMAEMEDDVTLVPAMYNLHAFNWECKKCGKQWYQGITPTYCHLHNTGDERNPECDSTEFERKMIWMPRKGGPRSLAYCFNNEMHFEYFKELEKRQENRDEPFEIMSIQGSCFMITRDMYWELDISSEEFHSWGQQGVEVACKTWLFGNKIKVNPKTWYAHLFRTQGGDFTFPYQNPMSKIQENRSLSRKLFADNTWPLAKKPFSSLLLKFWPVHGWTEDDLKAQLEKEGVEDVDSIMNNLPKPEIFEDKRKQTKGVIYYTDNKLDPALMKRCQEQILKGIKEKHVVSASLEPIKFGHNECLPGLTRGYVTMTLQILAALQVSKADIVFFCEHDVLYHPSHFNFIPSKRDKYYYNTNVWRVRSSDGHGLYVDGLQQLSGLVGNRKFLIEHFSKRLTMLFEAEKKLSLKEYSNYVRAVGFEPGTHNRAERVDDFKSENYQSEFPNVDIRHDTNLTPSRWEKEQFKNKKFTEGWTESDVIPGWGEFKQFIK